MELERASRPIVDHDVVEDAVLPQLRQHCKLSGGVHPEQHPVLGYMQDDVANDLALKAGDERFAAPPSRQALDLVGRQVVKELGAVRSADIEPDSIGTVDETGM